MAVHTITNKIEFEALIKSNNKIVFLVNSSWSGPSVVGFSKFKKVAEDFAESAVFCTIDNSSAESFIYEWLKVQEGKKWDNGTEIPRKESSRIHGYGELFLIKNGFLAWFESSIHNLTEELLISKI